MNDNGRRLTTDGAFCFRGRRWAAAAEALVGYVIATRDFADRGIKSVGRS